MDLAAALSVVVLGWLYLKMDLGGFLLLVFVTLALALLVGLLVRAAPESRAPSLPKTGLRAVGSCP